MSNVGTSVVDRAPARRSARRQWARAGLSFGVGVVLTLGLEGCKSSGPEAAPATVTVTATPAASTSTPSPSESYTPTEASSSAVPSETPEPAAFGPYPEPVAPGVTVVDSGWTTSHFLGWDANFGAVLYNNGPSANVSVTVQGIHDDAVVSSTSEDFTHVPAYGWFVYGGVITDLKAKGDTLEFSVSSEPVRSRMIDVDLEVQAIAPKGKRYQNVPVSITNSGTATMQRDSAIYVAILDDKDRIFTGGDSFTSVPIPGRQTVRDVIQDVDMQGGGAKTALAYVDLLNADKMFN